MFILLIGEVGLRQRMNKDLFATCSHSSEEPTVLCIPSPKYHMKLMSKSIPVTLYIQECLLISSFLLFFLTQDSMNAEIPILTKF